MNGPIDKKKPSLTVVMMGKKDPEAPDPLEKPAAPPNRFGKAPAEEAAETPAHEGDEEYGARLVKDIETAGEAHGLDPQQSRAFAASLFGAIAECLRGSGEPGDSEQGGQSDQY